MTESLKHPRQNRDYKRLIAITALNASVMLFSGVRGISENEGALLSEMAHDMGDTGVNGARAVAYKRERDGAKIERFRKVTYFIVCLLGFMTATKSGFDFFEAMSNINGFNNFEENIDRVFDGLVIAGFNQASYGISTGFTSNSDLAHDARHHARVDRNASLGLAACLIVGSVVPGVAEAGGSGMGLYTAYHMRPTKENLNGHSHH